jgi:type IV secretion system protein VirD4
MKRVRIGQNRIGDVEGQQERSEMRKVAIVQIGLGLVIVVSVVLAWDGAGAGAMKGAALYRMRQVELTAAWPVLAESARVQSLAARPDRGNADPTLIHPPTFRAWQDRPISDRWAQYNRPEWARVRLITRGALAILAAGVCAALARIVGRGLWFLLMLSIMRRRTRPGASHGSAHWADAAELRAMRPRKGHADLVIGQVGRSLVSIREREQYEHLLLVAPTGAGKTSGVILPNLLAEPGSRSLVITDPKRELLRTTAPQLLRRYGDNHVWALDFLDPALSRGYNPLAYVTDAATADLFAQTWVRNTGESKDVFWSNAARTLIAAAALHLVSTEEIVPPLVALMDLLCGTPAETVSATLAASPVPEVRRLARGFLANMAKNERLLGSVFTELPPRFTCLNIASVRATTGVNEIDFARLTKTPTALYLALDPQYGRTLAPLTASFFLHFFTTLTARAKAVATGALPTSVMAYLDEFGTIGHIPEFASRMATVRSAGIGCLLVIQDKAQLEKAYGKEDADTILSNATTKLCLARVTRDDAEYFSDLAGATTVLAANQSASRPLLLPWADRGNRGMGEVQRALITPDELRTMREEIFIIAGDHNPIRARQRRYYDDPALARLLPDRHGSDPLIALHRAVPLPMPMLDLQWAASAQANPAPAVPSQVSVAAPPTASRPPAAPGAVVAPQPPLAELAIEANRQQDPATAEVVAPPSTVPIMLTPSQRRLLTVLATMPTASSTELAASLGLQRSTVRDTLMKIRRALGVGQGEDIVVVAQQRGLLPEHDGSPASTPVTISAASAANGADECLSQ